MTLEQRKQTFYNAVVTKNWAKAKQSRHQSRYLRLVFLRRSTELFFGIMLIFGGQQFLVESHFLSPLWVSAGVGLCALFLRGNSMLVGIFLGTLTSYTINHVSWSQALAQSFLFIAFLFSIRTLALRWIGPVTPLSTLSVLWKFITLIAAFCALHVLGLHVLFYQTLPALSFWYLGWLGEMLAILCIVPLCLMFNPFVPEQYFRLSAWRWWVTAIILLIAQGGLYVVSPSMSVWLSGISFIALSVYARLWGKIPTAFLLSASSVIYLGGPHFLTPIAPVLLTLFLLSVIASLSVAIGTSE